MKIMVDDKQIEFSYRHEVWVAQEFSFDINQQKKLEDDLWRYFPYALHVQQRVTCIKVNLYVDTKIIHWAGLIKSQRFPLMTTNTFVDCF